MREDTTIPFTNPAFRDELSELVREGAQRIIRHAVEIARHALAIDERRYDFQPTILQPRRKLNLKQVWFVGVHADVGGSYKQDKDGSLLSDIPLGWMMREAGNAGLAFEPHLNQRLKPSPTATLHDSSSLIFRSWKDLWRPINHRKGKVLIHESVHQRWVRDKKYRPENLKKYTKQHPNWHQNLEK